MANLEEISASGINNNFTALNNELATKANLNGDSTQVFNVADAVTSTEAVSKGQLDSVVAGINSFATLDTSNMPTLANNATTPNTKIDFSAGFCWDDTLTKKIVSTAMTKRLDATFTAGTGNGGLDTGSKANNTLYHCFAIAKNDNTSDFLFSTSISSPNMPTDYTYKRRIGSIRTNASGNIVSFYQDGDKFYLQPRISEYNDYITSTYTNIITSAPPNTEVLLQLNSPIGNTDNIWIKTAYLQERGIGVYMPAYTVFNYSILLGSDRIISLRIGSATPVPFNVNTQGWIDKRGKK